MGAKLIWANKRLVTAATTFAITGYVAAAHYQQQRTVMKESEQIVARALEQVSFLPCSTHVQIVCFCV